MPEHVVPKKIYFIICGVLLILTLTTYEVALINLGPWNVVVALTIAFCKSTLVALFFMHVLYSQRRTLLVVLTGLFWLALLIGLTMADYATRHPVH